MIPWLRHLFGWILSALGSRKDLVLENLALREQLLALHARRPRRRLSPRHKLFLFALRRLWSGWQKPLVLITPPTVIAWHQAGFRLYGKWLSRARRAGGRKRVNPEVRDLIFRMAGENPTWGAPRMHGELLKLGFDLSEPTVSRRLRRAPRIPAPAQRWLTFLRNHREAIAAMDFFTVPLMPGFLISGVAALFGFMITSCRVLIIGAEIRNIIREYYANGAQIVNDTHHRLDGGRRKGGGLWDCFRSQACFLASVSL